MQRSYSTSSANHQPYNRSSRSIPIRLVTNKYNDCYSSDTDTHHKTYLQRTSSTSSFCSTNSIGSANYRILPVRYSSVDRIIQKPAIVSANERGINVRIRFERPHSHHHHRHEEEYEHHHKRHMTNEHQHYNSCPILNKTIQNSNSVLLNQRRPSNINYITTRSIVRGRSSDELNKTNHSTTLIIRPQLSLPSTPRIAYTRIKHIPLDTHSIFKPLITRVIREEEE
jgi:hypothetical protein